MAIFRFVAIFLSIAVFASVARGFEIDGQVFIVTEGGQSIKLGLVKVSLYDLKTMEDALQARKKPVMSVFDYFIAELHKHAEQDDALRKESDVLSEKMTSGNSDALKAEQDQITLKRKQVMAKYDEDLVFGDFPYSGQYCFQVLPTELQSTKTDADGHFSFQVKDGSYAVATQATRKLMGKIETYYWIVKVVSGDQPKVTVMLANDNCSYSKYDKNAQDVLLQDLNYESETKVHELMGNHDLPWLLNYIEERKKADAAEKK
ncbi:MAG: hypothetical protein WCD79_18890 [Chthoniobacteraceae bacterium]